MRRIRRLSAAPAASTASSGASSAPGASGSASIATPWGPSLASVPGGPWSGAWSAPAGATEVAASDGTRLMDATAGSAGCEAQMTIKASGSATLITVLWGAGCAKLGG